VSRRQFVILLLPVIIVACATALQTEPIPAELRDSSLRYFVENHGNDKRGLDRLIAQQIHSHGIETKSGFSDARPEEFDVLVIYEDRWQWDMSNYLIFLRIDFRDPETNVLLATGSSYQSSGARKPEGEVVAQIIAGMFASRE